MHSPLHPASAPTRLIVLVAYDGCQSLDVTGPWEVFTKAARFAALRGAPDASKARPAYRLVLASPHGGAVRTNSGLHWAHSTAIAGIHGRIDTVLVAGGDAEAFEPGGSAASLLPWLQRKARVVRRLGSVCTGAFALAGAGLLDGRRATTHWQHCARLASAYPAVRVEPDAIYVVDPPFYCSAGISAAMDLSLALVEADLGQSVALSVARELVLYLHRPGGQAQFSAGLQAQMQAGQRFRDLVMWMLEHPKNDFTVRALAQRMAISERHFARQFLRETGQTPARFADAVRTDHAKRHLEQTTWPLKQVAQRAGFGSVDSLQRSLRRHTGISADLYRQRFGRSAAAPPHSRPAAAGGSSGT
ncbi:GlxA family transcriptional regulator [Verminephrobacter aporrectodeae]|uniref:GlxA family transcriptional regulator n=1 Tax=Verminephrobacter aporrectodeae TaxID=1110389 RepID=UPI002244D44B|nr:helix-turn-helix domain-containing protein [Verminephrobacter aporrectodeae]MCW8175433.1 helix-turn-helix domain-containing protein [Verminephrobacter aporrectodeae subsp. tuberculatae]MCW8201348.1 helix-turn-helix domain-containing protein [Verminephrobacter aporrectodeae subsp. tuberculatae]